MTPFGLILLCCMVTGYDATDIPMNGVIDLGGKFEGKFNFSISEEIVGWEAILTFNEPVTSLTSEIGEVLKKNNNNTRYVLVSKTAASIQHTGQTLVLTIRATHSGSAPPNGTASLINMGRDNMTVPPLPTLAGAKYNYDEVLEKSILFYEAQRSGKLPPTNRIPWRGDSALNDSGANGEDLTGGWYDAGDHVKFGFPMSATVTILAWGFLEYKDAYEAAGQLEHMYDCLRWPLEWLQKTYTSPNEIYFQVGDGTADHSFWGRPEDMTMDRPAFKVTADKPGSDLAGEYAAALCAGYLVFKDKDPQFAAQLLQKAKEIYAFGEQYKGLYSDSSKQVAPYYSSGDYEDELCWGGAWLYRATGEAKYLTSANSHYRKGADWGLSWGNKMAGCQVLMYKLTKNATYEIDINATFTSWFPGGSVPYSPKGLAFRNPWGSLRHTANMAFLAIVASDLGINKDEYRTWAKSQIHYILGDSGRSYVVGFGVNPPSHPHHRGSSCPMMPVPCGWEEFNQTGPNPHTLYGGLVGGPDVQDIYADKRQDYVKNEVACDYNAGFQSAVAGLRHLLIRGELP